MEIKEILKKLTALSGVSGNEFPASHAAAELLGEYAEKVSVDSFGSVVGYIEAAKPGTGTLMLDAHIDRVGMIVTFIDEKGFLCVGNCGSPDVKTFLAQSVTVHGRKDIPGVICTLPPHVSKDKGKAPEISDVRIDVGLSKAQAEQIIAPGDRITLNSRFKELSDNVVSAPALDDRSGVCTILAALDKLGAEKPHYNVVVSFTAGEEVNGSGAKQTAFRIQPDKAIAVDVSFGATPDGDPHCTAPLGSGAMIGFSARLDKKMSQELKTLAVNKHIPFTSEVMPNATGTNADSIGISGRGVRCATVSLPIRYMHTAVEAMDIRDIESAADLICEYMRCADD